MGEDLGGFRDAVSGDIYLHAACQTVEDESAAPAEAQQWTRATQACATQVAAVQTASLTHTAASQAPQKGVYQRSARYKTVNTDCVYENMSSGRTLAPLRGGPCGLVLPLYVDIRFKGLLSPTSPETRAIIRHKSCRMFMSGLYHIVHCTCHTRWRVDLTLLPWLHS